MTTLFQGRYPVRSVQCNIVTAVTARTVVLGYDRVRYQLELISTVWGRKNVAGFERVFHIYLSTKLNENWYACALN